MFMDHVVEELCLLAAGHRKSVNHNRTQTTPEMLRHMGLAVQVMTNDTHCARYRLDRSFVELMSDLTMNPAQLEANRKDLYLPNEQVWLEYANDPGELVGMLIDSTPTTGAPSTESCRIGCFVVFVKTGENLTAYSGKFDFRAERMVYGNVDTLNQDLVYRAGLVLMAFAAVMATPRLVDRTPSDLTRLNAGRARKRKMPLLEHSVLKLTKTAQDDHRATQGGSGECAGRAFHHVRAFLRLRLGKVEFVRPHTRGNADKPMKRARVVRV